MCNDHFKKIHVISLHFLSFLIKLNYLSTNFFLFYIRCLICIYCIVNQTISCENIRIDQSRLLYRIDANQNINIELQTFPQISQFSK